MFENRVIILLIALLIGNYMAIAQYEIVGDLVTNFDNYGYGAVSDISDDGNRIIVSSINTGVQIGGVKVFEFNTQTNKWEQLGQKLGGMKSLEYFGDNVSISGDGDTIAIRSSNLSGGGGVFIYRFHKGSWTLIGSGIHWKNWGSVGAKVILNTDGSKLIVSGTPVEKKDKSYRGVMLFELDKANDTWNQIGDILKGEEPGGEFGIGIAMNTDFNRMVVGDALGNVKIYDISTDKRGDIWKQRGNTISSENYTKSYYGPQLAITDDGNYIVLGEPATPSEFGGRTVNPGYVQAYKFNGKKWESDGSKLIHGKGLNNDYFGRSIALDPKGERLIVGKPKNSRDGLSNSEFYVYDYNGNDWIVSEDVLKVNLNDKGYTVNVNMTPDKSRIVVSGDGGVVGVYQEPKASILGLDNRLNNSDTPITLYPNPVKSGFTISLSNSVSRGLENKECVLDIVDNVGRTVITKSNINVGSSLYVPTEHLHSGVYFIRIKGSERSQVYVKRIVKR